MVAGLATRASVELIFRFFPRDLSLVAMDDHPLLEHTDPALTAIHMPMDEMGALGTRMLLDLVGGEPLHHAVTSTPPRLVIRHSTAALSS